MIKNTLTTLLLFLVTYSYSQNSKVLIEETNINHNGFSLGVYLAGDNILYSKGKKSKKDVDSYNLYSAKIIDSINFDIENATELKEVNITYSNGSPSVFEDELYYTANSGLDEEYFENQETEFTVNKSGENTLQIFISKRNNEGNWQFPTYATFSNIEHNFTTPFISQDGSKLYFSSDKPGGFGGYDIYVSERQEDDSWGEPQNLGENVNSVLNNVYPFVIDNNLYFSSKQDTNTSTNIYYSSNVNGDWEAKKEFTALNSSYDDFGVRFITASTGYFSSNRDGGDIDKTYYFRINKSKEEKLISAVSKNEGKGVASSITKVDTLIIEKKTVDVTNTKLISSKAVYFDLNEVRVKSDGRFELDKIAYKMNNNSNYVVEILGYTDASGANEMNLKLSEKRANSVEEYLKTKGIAKTKIVEVKGYGEKNLINDCVDYSKCGEEANAKNRRVEVKILEIIK